MATQLESKNEISYDLLNSPIHSFIFKYAFLNLEIGLYDASINRKMNIDTAFKDDITAQG